MKQMLRTIVPRRDMDPIVRLIVTQWIVGATLGAMCAVLVLAFDIAGLRGMLFRPSHVVWEGVVLLFGGFAVTFGSVVSGSAVMHVPRDDDGRNGGADRAPAGEAAARLTGTRTRP